MSSSRRGVVVFGGGSAANCLVNVFDELAEKNRVSFSHVIPISDNGGSSSELLRCFGGPGIGDVRSVLRLLLFCSLPSFLPRNSEESLVPSGHTSSPSSLNSQREKHHGTLTLPYSPLPLASRINASQPASNPFVTDSRRPYCPLDTFNSHPDPQSFQSPLVRHERSGCG